MLGLFSHWIWFLDTQNRFYFIVKRLKTQAVSLTAFSQFFFNPSLKETFLLNPNDTFRFSSPNHCSMYNVYNFSGSRDQTRQRLFTGMNPNLVAVRKYPPPPGNVHLLHVTHCPQPHFWNFWKRSNSQIKRTTGWRLIDVCFLNIFWPEEMSN